MSAPNDSPFLSLPGEIRTIVYRKAYKNAVLTLTPRPTRSDTKPSPGKTSSFLIDHSGRWSLLFVCKSIYYESLDIFWQLATIDSSQDDSHFVSFGSLKGNNISAQTNFNQNGRLRNLIIQSPFFHGFDNSYLAMDALFTYKRNLETIPLLTSLELSCSINTHVLDTNGLEYALNQGGFDWCASLWCEVLQLTRMVVSLSAEVVEAIVKRTDKDWRTIARRLLLTRLQTGETVDILAVRKGQVDFVIRR